MQPNDTEKDTPKDKKIKVECLNRFHLISLAKVRKKMHMRKKKNKIFYFKRLFYDNRDNLRGNRTAKQIVRTKVR